MKRIVIIGASGHGKVVADIAKLNDYEEIVFLDDDVSKTVCGRYAVVGTASDIDDYQDYDFIVAIGNNLIRKKMIEILEDKKVNIVTLIHPTSVIADDVVIDKGCVVSANCVINAASIIKKGCIINTSSSIDHDCIIEDYVHVSPGVHVAGSVHIGKCCWLGIGTSVINNVSIVANSVIGAGSTVINDVNESGTYVGSPIRKVR